MSPVRLDSHTGRTLGVSHRPEKPMKAKFWSLASVIAALVATAATAAGPPPARTTDECSTGIDAGVPGCVSRQGQMRNVPPDERRLVTLACPERAPYFWNWSSDGSVGMFVTLSKVRKRAEDGRAGAAEFVVHNQGIKLGSAAVFLGCSKTVARVQSRMTANGSLRIRTSD